MSSVLELIIILTSPLILIGAYIAIKILMKEYRKSNR
jgi:uncharacterized protein YneF (UPF0154 family)